MIEFIDLNGAKLFHPITHFSIINIETLPVCVFFYNRSDLALQCLNAVSRSSDGLKVDLYIFIDGPRNNIDKNQIKEVVYIIDNFDFSVFNDVVIKKNSINYGLSSSIINGVSKVVREYGYVLVIEDDLIVSRNFMHFMKESLEKYQYNKKIGSVSGFSFALRPLDNYDVYFHPRPTSWGWGTWYDRWNQVNWMVDPKYLEEINYSKKKFNELGQDMHRMLKGYLSNRVDSWAIRWALYHWKSKWIAITPYKSKVVNNGFGNNLATNTKVTNEFLIKFDESNNIGPFSFPETLIVEKRNKRIVNFYNGNFLRFLQKYSPKFIWDLFCKNIFRFF